MMLLEDMCWCRCHDFYFSAAAAMMSACCKDCDPINGWDPAQDSGSCLPEDRQLTTLGEPDFAGFGSPLGNWREIYAEA